jgi:hypothetical protein
MSHRVVTVQFSRSGPREGVELDAALDYQVRLDGGPPSTFRSPWTQQQLDEHVETLRNKGDQQPAADHLRELGKQLGDAIGAIRGMEGKLVRQGGEHLTVCWQLDYPELARLPWELATSNQPPYRHLLEDVSFIRKVPAALEDVPANWPTGLNQRLRLLFVWGEDKPDDVPHAQHHPLLQTTCDEYDVDLVAKEITDVSALTQLCVDAQSKPFHFVHVLAHGARAGGGWGLRLRNEVVSGEQLARALRSGGTTPAVVTVSACDSANEKDASFGSVAYYLHAYGVPFVVASQFRLRKTVSVVSADEVYRSLLGGGDVRDLLCGIRRQLAPAGNEAWANEVIYSRYRYESLDELAVVACQQAALRRANAIERKARAATVAEWPAFIEALDAEERKLSQQLERLQAAGAEPRVLAETCGLLGSMQRRKARLRATEDPEELREALSWYEKGMRADANSHYCGINVVHLSLRLGDQAKADEYLPLVRFAARNQADRDFWALATAGELEVYAGDEKKAADLYRSFAQAVAAKVDRAAIAGTLAASKRQLGEVAALFAGRESIRRAADSSSAVLESAIRRNA